MGECQSSLDNEMNRGLLRATPFPNYLQSGHGGHLEAVAAIMVAALAPTATNRIKASEYSFFIAISFPQFSVLANLQSGSTVHFPAHSPSQWMLSRAGETFAAAVAKRGASESAVPMLCPFRQSI